MFTAVLTKHTASRGGVVLSQMRYVRERIQSNCERLTDYYQNSGGWVNSRHILIRLLSNLTVPMHTPTELYYEYVLDNYDTAGRSLGVTTAINKGAVHLNGSFYGMGSNELYLGIESVLNPEQVHNNWRQYQPIRVLRHPYCDLDMPFPDGRGFTGGVAVFTFDIPMMAVMYRAWNLEEAQKPAGQRETPAQFIYQYILPGILPSSVDVALFNRVVAASDNVSGEFVKKRHAIALPTVETNVGHVLDQYLDWAVNSRRTFQQLLDVFPQVFGETIVSTVTPRSLLRTRQNKWLTTVAEVPLVSWLLLIDSVTDSHANTEEKTELARDIRIMDNERLFQGTAGGVLADIRQDIRDNIEPYV